MREPPLCTTVLVVRGYSTSHCPQSDNRGYAALCLMTDVCSSPSCRARAASLEHTAPRPPSRQRAAVDRSRRRRAPAATVVRVVGRGAGPGLRSRRARATAATRGLVGTTIAPGPHLIALRIPSTRAAGGARGIGNLIAHRLRTKSPTQIRLGLLPSPSCPKGALVFASRGGAAPDSHGGPPGSQALVSAACPRRPRRALTILLARSSPLRDKTPASVSCLSRSIAAGAGDGWRGGTQRGRPRAMD